MDLVQEAEKLKHLAKKLDEAGPVAKLQLVPETGHQLVLVIDLIVEKVAHLD